MNSNSYCNFFPNRCILKIKIRVPHNQSSTRLGEMPSGSRWCSTKTRPEILPTERGLLWLTMNQYQSSHGFVLNNIKASNIYSRAIINFLYWLTWTHKWTHCPYWLHGFWRTCLPWAKQASRYSCVIQWQQRVILPAPKATQNKIKEKKAQEVQDYYH